MSMSQSAVSYWRVVVTGTAAVGIFCAGVYSARASGAETSSRTLSYAGVLVKDDQPLTGQQTLSFSFKKSGRVLCSSPRLDVTPDAAGRFQVLIPMSGCPNSLFDGSSVTVDISVGSDIAAQDVAVTSVPYALHAEQLGSADCPAGYDRESADSAVPNVIGCVRGEDHVVRVGTGATAFWIDRYEASVWSDMTAQGIQWGSWPTESATYPDGFPLTGQTPLEKQLYALSKVGVLPSTNLTWFQASRACRASGKRLASNEEWTEAALGTPKGTEGAGPCTNVQEPVHQTGQGRNCVSVWGAEDMVGNVTELVSEWVIGVGSHAQTDWSPPFSGAMWNVASTTLEGTVGPMSIQRGSGGGNKWDASVFSVGVTQTVGEQVMGFRCMIPR